LYLALVAVCFGQGFIQTPPPYWYVVAPPGALATRPLTCTANFHAFVCNGAGCGTNGEYHYCTATDTWTVGASGAAAGWTYNSGTNTITAVAGATVKIGTTVFGTAGAASPIVGIGTSRFIHNYADPTATGDNTFLGVSAGNFTMSPAGGAAGLASFNTGIGANALIANTTGAGHTAVGHNALRSNTIGQANTGLGQQVLYSNTIGSNNTGVGLEALYSNVDGVGNAAFGESAMYANLSGSSNTAVGMFAGHTETPANANTTGSNNTWVGSESGPGAVTQFNNTIGIGYRSHPTASNQAVFGNSSITSTVLYGSADLYGTGPMYVTHPAADTGQLNGYKMTDALANEVAQVTTNSNTGEVKIGGVNASYFVNIYSGNALAIGITTAGVVSIRLGGSSNTVMCWKADGITPGYATVAEITSGTCH
jgi:hypothetical protein